MPLVTIVLGALLQRLMPLFSELAPPAVLRYSVGGVFVAGVILGLGLWAVLVVRASGQSENPWSPTTTIVERGPFRLSRNPMYLQMVLVCIGLSFTLWNVWILLLTPLCVYVLRSQVIAYEEAYLEAKFGNAYRDYQRRVRRWI